MRGSHQETSSQAAGAAARSCARSATFCCKLCTSSNLQMVRSSLRLSRRYFLNLERDVVPSFASLTCATSVSLVGATPAASRRRIRNQRCSCGCVTSSARLLVFIEHAIRTQHSRSCWAQWQALPSSRHVSGLVYMFRSHADVCFVRVALRSSAVLFMNVLASLRIWHPANAGEIEFRATKAGQQVEHDVRRRRRSAPGQSSRADQRIDAGAADTEAGEQ